MLSENTLKNLFVLVIENTTDLKKGRFVSLGTFS